MTATAYPPESGCMQVTLEYVWVGDVAETIVNQPLIPVTPPGIESPFASNPCIVTA